MLLRSSYEKNHVSYGFWYQRRVCCADERESRQVLLTLVFLISPMRLHPIISEKARLSSGLLPRFSLVGTVHVAVVDPGVGMERKGLIITTKKQILVGPDNGILLPTAHLLGDFVVYEITNPKYMIHPLSRTFHGRDIFAPVAAYIAKGIPFGEIGTKTTHFVDLQFSLGEHRGDRIVGKVMYVDRFGNLITNIPSDILPRMLSRKKQR